jgi:hypothetical protein
MFWMMLTVYWMYWMVWMRLAVVTIFAALSQEISVQDTERSRL